MIMTGKKIYNSDGRSSEDKALDKFAEMMIEKIKTLQNDWKKPWFTDKSISWPRNLSGREYNGMNALLLMMHCEKQGYKLPVFCTFDRVAGLNYTKDKQGVRQQIKDNNGQELPKVSILKGEKSFPVFITTFTVVDKETKEKIKYDDYKQLSEEEKKGYNVYPKLQVYNVFNVAQTNLQEARPDLYKKLADAGKQIRPQSEGEEFSFAPLDRIIRIMDGSALSNLLTETVPTTAFQRMRLSFLRKSSSRMVSHSIPISVMRCLIPQEQRISWEDYSQHLLAVRSMPAKNLWPSLVQLWLHNAMV